MRLEFSGLMASLITKTIPDLQVHLDQFAVGGMLSALGEHADTEPTACHPPRPRWCIVAFRTSHVDAPRLAT